MTGTGDDVRLEQCGWVTFRGVPGHSEPGQAFLHGHLPDEFGGAGPDHQDCEPLYRVKNIEGDRQP